jgi:hypothetical protein
MVSVDDAPRRHRLGRHNALARIAGMLVVAVIEMLEVSFLQRRATLLYALRIPPTCAAMLAQATRLVEAQVP